MPNKYYRRLTCLLFFISPLAFCKAPLIVTNNENKPQIENWQESAITIDGIDNDWDLNKIRVDSTNQLMYKISNDAFYLYVCIKSNNDCIKMRILEAGMYLYVNTNGKKKETAGIVFPIANRTSFKPIYRKIYKIDTSNMYKYLNNLKEFSIFGLGGAENPTLFSYEGENDLNVNVKVGLNKKFELIYEAAIPLTLLNTTDITGITKPSKSVAIGIVVNPFPNPATLNDISESDRMPPIFTGIPKLPEDMLFKETKIWNVVKIATHR